MWSNSEGIMLNTRPDGDRQRVDVPQAQQVPMVLANASYYGTLAAVRALGRAGVQVTTVDPARLGLARYSRYSSQHLKCPAFEATDQWAEWLLRLGRSGPPRAVYATSDAVSFALARHRNELSAAFNLYQPECETIISILDKGRLLQDARAVGMDTPTTWFPQTAEEAAKIASEISGGVLIKPRSQLAQRNHKKGGLVVKADGRQVRATFDVFRRDATHNSEFARQCPESMTPLLQEYYPEAKKVVYSLTGFREESSGRTIMRGAKKVFSRPRQIGVGLCFEDAPVLPDLAQHTVRLCERIGYYGAFELEFVMVGQKAMLIDFNGRFYNQLAFDIGRGMDLAWIAHAAATDDRDTLARAIASAGTTPRESAGIKSFRNRVELAMTLKMQRVCNAMSRKEADQWRHWPPGPSGNVIDAIEDDSDPLPSYIDRVEKLMAAVRHPRAFVRQFGSP
jgi:predicted ATP-grasp superfamily ATP-dependent carboligase